MPVTRLPSSDVLGAEGRRLYTPDFLLSLGITHVMVVWDPPISAAASAALPI
jgi:hypothetical protein